MSPRQNEPLFLAFPSGRIAFDCERCGRCCRKSGLPGDTPEVVARGPLATLAAFAACGDADTPGLTSFYGYRDGCRFLNDAGRCDLHGTGKPGLCRLYPLSRAFVLDGLPVLLPHDRCPWTGSATLQGDSTHAHVQSLLGAGAGAALTQDGLEHLDAVTALSADTRFALESSIRDRLDFGALDGRATVALEQSHSLQAELVGPPLAPPADAELWLDLLRCAGMPAPLSPDTERTFIAAIPAMRLELCTRVPLLAVPNTLRAFALWLGSLAELGPRSFSGRDLLALLHHALPLLRLLAFAECPLPALPKDAPTPSLTELWRELGEHAGQPTAKTLLYLLRPLERGALSALAQLGEYWPFERVRPVVAA